jgi:hypothetical protein
MGPYNSSFFLTLFELAHRRHWTGGSTRGPGASSTKGRARHGGGVFFFFCNSGNFVLFAIRPSESSFFFRSFRARTPDPREVWFHDVPWDELDSGASSSPGRGFQLLAFANS